MKKLLILLVTASTLSSFAQTIPNSGFETWNQYDGALPVQVPQHWWSIDVIAKAFNPSYSGHSVLQTNQSHSGTSAVLMQTNISVGDTISGRIYASDSVGFAGMPQGFACTQRPATCSGYYKLNTVGGDSVGIYITMTKWNGNHRDTIATNGYVFPTNISTYTQFSFPLTYLLNQYPDTANIIMGIVGPNNKVSHVGTQFFIDDLAFSGSVPLGIKENSKENDLVHFYPNPFSSTAVISINNSVSLNNSKLVISDINGKEIKTMELSSYKTNINRDGLESGVYFYKLYNGKIIAGSGKFIIE